MYKVDCCDVCESHRQHFTVKRMVHEQAYVCDNHEQTYKTEYSTRLCMHANSFLVCFIHRLPIFPGPFCEQF